MDELVGPLHGFYEPLLFFVQGADDPQSHVSGLFLVFATRFLGAFALDFAFSLCKQKNVYKNW
jgi:hypothetical protein